MVAFFTPPSDRSIHEAGSGSRRINFQQDAAAALEGGLLKQAGEFGGGRNRGEPLRTDVGNAVAVGIGLCRAGLIGEVGTQTIRRAEAGTFAEQGQRVTGA